MLTTFLKTAADVYAFTQSPIAQLGMKALSSSFIIIDFTNAEGSTSKVSTNRLLEILKEYSTPFNALTVWDRAVTSDARILGGVGTYFPVIADCRLIAQLSTGREDTETNIKLYIPRIYSDKLNLILETINPLPEDLPSVFSVPSRQFTANARDINTSYRLGPLLSIYAEQRQLIDEDIYNEVDAVFKRFKNNPKYYAKRLISHKESILLYGPPGTGKTSLIRHLASKYDMDWILANSTTLEPLPKILTRKSGKRLTVIMFEDIDSTSSLCVNADDAPVGSFRHGNQTDEYSQFLNYLDGGYPLNDVIVVITTNYLEKLKPAIYRLGRVNHRIEVGYPKFETVLKQVGYPENDERSLYLENLEDKELPLEALNDLKYATTLEDVKRIIAVRDHHNAIRANSLENIGETK